MREIAFRESWAHIKRQTCYQGQENAYYAQCSIESWSCCRYLPYEEWILNWVNTRQAIHMIKDCIPEYIRYRMACYQSQIYRSRSNWTAEYLLVSSKSMRETLTFGFRWVVYITVCTTKLRIGIRLLQLYDFWLATYNVHWKVITPASLFTLTDEYASDCGITDLSLLSHFCYLRICDDPVLISVLCLCITILLCMCFSRLESVLHAKPHFPFPDS